VKDSDRDRNVNKVKIIGCVLKNFYYETFTKQMNLFTEAKHNAIYMHTAISHARVCQINY